MFSVIIYLFRKHLLSAPYVTDTVLKDVIKREEGGRFRMGNTCIPVADSF